MAARRSPESRTSVADPLRPSETRASDTAHAANRHCDAELTLRFGQNLLNGLLERFDGLCASQQVAVIKDDRRH
jgi:hypothetical protein